MMKALVMNGTSKELQVVQVEVPTIGDRDILLRVKYAGICGSDLHLYTRNAPLASPLLPGHEFSGVVEEIGTAVTGFSIGDTVTVNPLTSCETCAQCKRGNPQRCVNRKVIGGNSPGGFAEFAKVPASACYRVSDPKAGALVEPLACGIRAARVARIEIGDTVAIFGAGIIGLFCMRAAQLMGATRTILIDTNEKRLEVAKTWGPSVVYHSTSDNVVEDVSELADGPIQAVLDAVGAEATRRVGIDLVEIGGRITWIGRHQNQMSVPGDEVVAKEIQINGTFCYAPDDFAQALNLVEQGIISPNSEWLSIRSLDEGKNCFEEQISREAKYPKIMYSLD